MSADSTDSTESTHKLSPIWVNDYASNCRFESSVASSERLYLDMTRQRLPDDFNHVTNYAERISVISVLTYPKQELYILDIVGCKYLRIWLPLRRDYKQIKEVSNLRKILEDREIPKYMWDGRDLAHDPRVQYGVRLAGVVELRLFENASRPHDQSREYLHELSSSIQADLNLAKPIIENWLQVERDFRDYDQKYEPQLDVFRKRPMEEPVLMYCIKDIRFFPALHEIYAKRITGEWLMHVQYESAYQIATAHRDTKRRSSGLEKSPWISGTTQHRMTLKELIKLSERTDESDG